MDYTRYIKNWDDLQVGQVEEVCKTMTEADVIMWCGLNPAILILCTLTRSMAKIPALEMLLYQDLW